MSVTGALLGLALGMRHALEPDHLTAISTLVAEERGAQQGAWLGLCWGLGHTVALVGVVLVLTLLDVHLPPRLADTFELGVALMLIVLGLRSIAARREKTHTHRFARRSLIVGIVHGLAGSGALTLILLAGLPSGRERIAYTLLFGAGSIVGMALLSGLAGWPLARVGRSWSRGVVVATGVLSIALGVAWGAPLLQRVFT